MSASSRRVRLGSRWLCLVAVVLFPGAALRAHEIGTTRVSVLFEEGSTYQVEVVTDAASLVEKLEASAGSPPPVDARPARLQSLLAGFDERFRQRMTMTFDGVEVRPQITYTVAPG